MSPSRVHQRTSTTPSVIATDNRRRSFLRTGAILGLAFLAILFAAPCAYAGSNVDLATDPNGITLTTVGNNYTATFGGLLNNMDALGISAPATNVYVIPLTNGALYYTYYDVFFKKVSGGHTAYVTGSVTTNFTHSQAFALWSCAYPSACNTSGSYSAMTGTVDVVPAPGLAQGNTVKVGVAIFLPDNDGASAYTGTDTVAITLTAIDFNTGTTIENIVLTLTSANLQTAVRLNLGTNASGLTVTPASDYSMNFGNVNALGISPGAGLATSAQAGGIIYSTPYDMLPAYSALGSTTGTITACVSTTFTHSAVLVLENSSTGSSGSFSNISTNCGSATSLTSSAGDRATITRYLGLFVSNVNGASSFRGTDTATLTYTLTVP